MFNSKTVAKLDTENVEILLNPVERMMVVRPCKETNPNAAPWKPKNLAARPIVDVIFDIMGWPADYSFRIPCQTQTRGNDAVLLFDLDNYIGHAINKKEEVIMARKEAEEEEGKRENAKSYFYPPEEDAEPQEIHEMEQRFQKLKEQNKKIFGEPVFQRVNSARGFEDQEEGEIWDMLIEARPLDINHTVDQKELNILLDEIREDPPRLPTVHADIIEVEGDE